MGPWMFAFSSDPATATPSAWPICRLVEATPDARPACADGIAATAALLICPSTIASPMPNAVNVVTR